MVNQTVWIGIVVGVFFAGIGISYVAFADLNDPGMMTNNMPQNQMTQETIHDMMMGSNPLEQHERMLGMMEVMMEDEDLTNHMNAHMLENEKIVHQILTIMEGTPHLNDHMTAHVSGDLSEYAYLDDMPHEDHGHEDEHE